MDFLINYYTNFLFEHNITLIKGFFIWHTLSFLVLFVLINISVVLFINLKNRLFTVDSSLSTDEKTELINSSFSKEIQIKTPYTIFAHTFSIAAIIFLSLILPYSTFLFPIKTEAGVLLFLSVILIPVITFLWLIQKIKNTALNKMFLNFMLKCVCTFIPVFISVLSAVVLSGTISLKDIVFVQNSHYLFSWFCFPAFLGTVTVILALSSLYSEVSDYLAEKNSFFRVYNFLKYEIMFIISGFIVLLFFGGYMPPIPFFISDFFEHSAFSYSLILTFEQIIWFLIKTFILFFLVIFINKKYLKNLKDSFNIEFYLKYLTPVAILNLFIVMIISAKIGELYAI